MERRFVARLVMPGYRWRIVLVVSSGEQDLCGAVNEVVAWQTAHLLNGMRGYLR